MKEISKIQNLKNITLKKELWWKIPATVLVLFILVVGGILAYKIVVAVKNIITQNLTGSAPALLGNLMPGQLKGEGDGRINILVLGIPGEGYEGPNLSDTNIVVSIDPKNKDAAMLSLPRDLYVNIPDFGSNKLNTVHSIGESNKVSGGGPALSKKVISNILDLPIHYFVRMDFYGFKKIIDILGGIEVKVDKNIVDYQFPDGHGGYKPFNLKAGIYNMDGDFALKYARSRYTTSDFDRAARQQKVLIAVKDKALKLENLLNPAKIEEIISTLSRHLKTDLQLWEIERLIGLAKDIDSSKVVSKVIDDSTNDLLYADNVNGMFVLRPKAGDFSQIAAFAHQIFIDSYIKEEKAKVALENGTLRSGVATELSNFLKSYGYNIVSVKMAKKTNYERTFIYDYTRGKKPYTLTYLAKRLNAEVKQGGESNNVDIKIILGANYTRPTLY